MYTPPPIPCQYCHRICYGGIGLLRHWRTCPPRPFPIRLVLPLYHAVNDRRLRLYYAVLDRIRLWAGCSGHDDCGR